MPRPASDASPRCAPLLASRCALLRLLQRRFKKGRLVLEYELSTHPFKPQDRPSKTTRKLTASRVRRRDSRPQLRLLLDDALDVFAHGYPFRRSPSGRKAF